MTAEQERAVLEILTSVSPPPVPERLEDWVVARLRKEPASVDPTRQAFDDHAGELFGYLCALTGRDAWLAEELLVRAFLRAEGAVPDRLALIQQARHAALEALAKAGVRSKAGQLPPADQALLLERRLGLELTELAQAWGSSEGM